MDEYGSAAGERPGCVTAYAILTWVGAAVYLIAAFIAGMSTDRAGSLGQRAV